MRNAFAAEMVKLAVADPRVVLLSGDIGNRLFDEFQARCPGRFFNCGVAEANMMSMAAGLAISGLRPVVYTIAAFATVRCLEQIRVDVAFQRQPIVIVGVGAGLSYASLNATHHCCEDIAYLRMMPGMTVVCPADSWEVGGAMRAALSTGNPVYVRLGKKGEPMVHSREPNFEIGKAIVVRPGRDVCLLATGTMVAVAMEAATALDQEGVNAQVVSFHTVKPLDDHFLAQGFRRFELVVTLEEHSAMGGLGGSVAEWLSDHPGANGRLLRLGTGDHFIYTASEQKYAREVHGLTSTSIAERTLGALKGAPRNRGLVRVG